MANLTSTLTLKLTDGLSGPAKQAADSLKGLGLSAQQLNQAVKFDGLRQAQASFRQAATSFEAARVNVRKLAQDFAATDAPTKQMAKALEQARAQASSAGQTFQQQSAVFRQARMDMQQLGVPLNQVATEEARLKSAVQATTTAMVQQAQQAQTLGARIRAGAGRAFGAIAPFLGPPILAATYKAVKAGAAIDSAQMGLRAAGIPDSEVARITKAALAQQALYPQLAVGEILDRYKEARSIGTAADSEKMLPVLAETAAALKALSKGAPGSTEGLGFALKAAQVLGAAQNPERLRTYLEAFIKAKEIKGDLITPEQIYSFMAGLKGSGALLSDRFLHTTAMSLAAELKGGRAGSGIDAFVKTIVAPVGAEAKEFLALGLMNRGDFETKARGGRGGFREHPGSGGIRRGEGGAGGGLGEVRLGAHVAGWQLAQTDPDKWVQQYLLPALRQKGFADLPSVLALVQKLFPGRSADIVTKLITQAEAYQDEAQKMRTAPGLEETLKLHMEDAPFQLEVLKQAFSTFGGVLTDPIMRDAARGMNFISRTFAEWAKGIGEWNAKNPVRAELIGGTAIAAGGIVGGGLTAGLAYNLWSGFGLKGSATALDVAAANLNAAALKLGATPGTPLTPPVPPISPWASAIPGLTTALQLYQLQLEAAEKAKTLAHTPFSWGSFGRQVLGLPGERQADGGASSPASFAERFGSFPSNIPRSGLRLSVPSAAPVMPSVAPSIAPVETGAPISPPAIDNRELDARAAGQAFGKAFRDAAVDEIRAAVSEADVLINKIIGLMTFSATPDVSPQGAGRVGATPFGPHADLLHGAHSDYGIAP